ncbi:MAG: DMT family transporter [Bacteroidales bacterium]|nr:DMT family transporter [Bacteroidales bacterium]
MWILCALVSALCLGFYDVFKKLSVKGNNVTVVLMLNTLFQTILMSPVLIRELSAGSFGLGDTVHGHLLILLKAIIVLTSWLLGYFAIKHLPLTIQGPINASRPVMVLVGALLIFGERLNFIQWCGIILGFASLYFISRIGSKEGFSFRHSQWLWMAIGATVCGAVSALYDKYLLQSFTPLDVQAWYSLYQCIIMTATLFLLRQLSPATSAEAGKFHWTWTIPFISVFLTVADLAYFYSLSIDGAMISIVSMVRRGSVIVPFIYGVAILHEKNVKAKVVDLSLLFVSLLLLIIGSH